MFCAVIEAGRAPVNAGSALLSGSSYSILQVAATVPCAIGWACPQGVIPGAATPVACPYAPILTTSGTGSTSLAQCESEYALLPRKLHLVPYIIMSFGVALHVAVVVEEVCT